MKKEYIKPTIEEYSIAVAKLVCASDISISDDPAQPGIDNLSNDRTGIQFGSDSPWE